jgi:hypothetical protein
VAENNIVMTDIINKLGVHERFDIAWKHVNYGGWAALGSTGFSTGWCGTAPPVRQQVAGGRCGSTQQAGHSMGL